jgi:hypothetical protein
MDFLTRQRLEQERAVKIAQILDLECDRARLEEELKELNEKLEN